MSILGAVDTHAHVFVRGLPTAEQARYLPVYDASPDAYLRQLDRHGIERAVLVQPSFLGADNSYLLSCLAAHPDRFLGVVVLEHPDAEVPEGVIGVRLNLIGEPVPDLADWRDLGDALARRGAHLEVQAEGAQWPKIAEELKRWPSRVVIDHLGLPGTGADDDVLALAALPHVWVKASAPYRSPAAPEMLTRLGTNRLVWGSDWPWTRYEGGRTYEGSLRWLKENLPDAVDDILVRNPARLLTP